MDLSAVRRVVVAHNPVGAQDDPSTADVLAQVELVETGLVALGIPFERIAVPDWKPWLHLRAAPGTVVFNLVEAPPGTPHVQPAAAAALDLLGLPYTGSPPPVLWITTDKLAMRALFASEGLPVAPGGRLDLENPQVLDRVPGPWILKPNCEDASVGLEGDPVCRTREEALARGRLLARRFPDQAVLAELYLPGRELNVSLLAKDGGVEALPVAEIVFEDFPEGMSRVVNYEAKWLDDSFDCIHTVRHFPEDPADAALLERVREISEAAWRISGLRGYARVDLRLDEDGNPHILEVNANPCLAADAGFLAAAARVGLTAGDVVGRILAAVPGVEPPVPSESSSHVSGIEVRKDLRASDRAPLEELIRATEFFNPEEIGVALELVDDRLANGEASHYQFLVGEVDGQVAGYACWGPVPGTLASVDLYWIVVHPAFQGKKAGSALLSATEEHVRSEGRTRVYVETSTRAQYHPTRAFYAACGYTLAAELPDFYAPGDGKAMFVKVLG